MNGELSYLLFVSQEDVGSCTIAFWPKLQPKLMELISKQPGLFVGAKISVRDDTYLLFTLEQPLKITVTKLEVAPLAGLAYMDQRGNLLVTLKDAAPPKGFVPVGQAAINTLTLRAWQSKPSKVMSTGGLPS